MASARAFPPPPQLSWPKGGRGFQVHEEIAVDYHSRARGALREELSRPISSSVSGILAVLDPRAGSTLHQGKNKHPRRNSRFSQPGLIGSPVCVPPPVNPSSLEACYPNTQKTLDFTSLSVEPAQGEMAEEACDMNEPMSEAASQPSRCESEAFPTQASVRPSTGKEHRDARPALPITAIQGRSSELSPKGSQPGVTALPLSSLGLHFLICKVGINH